MTSTESAIACKLNDLLHQGEKILKAIQEQSGGTGASQYSWTTACASDNGRLIRIRINNVTGATTFWEANTNTQITGITAIKCEPNTVTPPIYNTVETYTLVGSAATGFENPTQGSKSIPANTAHSVSYVVLQGRGSIKIGDNPSQTLVVGQSASVEASFGLLDQTYIISPTTPDGVISLIITK